MNELVFSYPVFDGIFSILAVPIVKRAGWKLLVIYILVSAIWISGTWYFADLMAA